MPQPRSGMKEAEGKQRPTGVMSPTEHHRKNTTPRHASPAFGWFPLELAMCTPHHAFHKPLSFRGGRSRRAKRGRAKPKAASPRFGEQSKHKRSLVLPHSPFVPPFAAHHFSQAGWLATNKHYKYLSSNMPTCQACAPLAFSPFTSTSMGVLVLALFAKSRRCRLRLPPPALAPPRPATAE
jgi:hypothetical protein